MRFRDALLLAPFALPGCAPPPRLAEAAPTTIHIDPVVVAREGTSGARFVPIEAPGSAGFGVEPGGGARAIAAGVRVVRLPGGGVLSAEDRLPGGRWEVFALPDRLGGGFLFKVDDKSLWRAEKWLGPARPIYLSIASITRVAPGLDRVYVMSKGIVGDVTWRAIDGTTGEPRPLGPWPASPSIGAYAAADGWRAVAIADLRGVVATSDAGATWRTISLPIEPREVVAKGDRLEVWGLDGSTPATYELRPDGQIVRAPDVHRAAIDAGGDLARGGARAEEGEASGASPMGPLGAHPLEAAVDDGWPLRDGTALVARDGALSRVRLEDGAVVETVPGAFPLRPSRCHPVALGVGAASFGFVCGEPRGATVLYAFDMTASDGAMTELRRFDVPRAVLASGNGAIVVRGPCDAHAPGDADPAAHHYCERTTDGAWSEIRVEGAIGDERVTALADGRFAIVSPPKGNLETARLTIVDKGRAQSVPIVFGEAPSPEALAGPELDADVSRVLAVGVWLDGIEERRPGVLGGWIEASGTMLGYELPLDGKIRLGAFVRGEHSLPMVSGRYGLGWSGAHAGYETTDGGMTWTSIPVPDPIRPTRAIASRACGPVGCSAAGWLRIGWGASPREPPPVVHQPAPSLPRTHLSLPLDCLADGPIVRSPARPPLAHRDDLLGRPPAAATAAEMRFVTLDTLDTRGTGPTGRMVVWGPKSGEWGSATKWVVRWLWPFGAASDVRSSAPAPAPALLIDAVRASAGSIFPLGWSVAMGDDPSHALLIASRRSTRAEGAVFELEGDRPPLEIRRAGGEALGEIEAVLRVAGRWYVATPGGVAATAGVPATRMDTVVWQVDGPVARELAHIPRISSDGRVPAGRLARFADGGALGYVVDGQSSPGRSGAARWVAPIDLDTGAVGDIEPLGSADLGDRSAISLCTSGDPGWSMDLALDGPSSLPILLFSQETSLGALHAAFGRVRLGSTRACVERLAGTLGPSVDPASPHHATQRPPSPTPASTTVTVGDRSERRVFRCGVR